MCVLALAPSVISNREQKFQHGPHAPRPACFVMGAPVDFFEVKGFAGEPVVGFEPPVEGFGVLDGAAAFLLAYVEPEAGTVPDLGCALVEVAEDALVVPPHARRKHCQ